jgi:hypothetical protein
MLEAMTGRKYEIGCPNPYDLELTPEILQLGERLSQEIANIQNALQVPGVQGICPPSPAAAVGSKQKAPAKTLGSTPQELVGPKVRLT